MSQIKNITGEGSKLIITLDDGSEITEFTEEEKEVIEKFPLNVSGMRNTVRIALGERKDVVPFFKREGLAIIIVGDDDTISLGRNVFFCVNPLLNIRGLSIIIGGGAAEFVDPKKPRYASRCTISIDANTAFCGACFYCQDDDSKITVGKDCMFSWGIDIWCTDVHAITDLEGNAQNFGKSIEIGDHVWIGKDVKVGKNTKVSANSVVGWGSIVTKKFDEENVIIVGNPAKIVKRGINWDPRDLQNYAEFRKEHLGESN